MQKHFKKGRVIISLLFFIAFIVAFADIKGNLPTHFYKAFLYFQFTPSVLEFITRASVLSAGFIFVLLLTILGGRVYCSALCPLGTLQDIVIYIKRKLKPKQRIRFTKALNVLRYSILAVTIISLIISGLFVINLLDPYANFGRIGTHIFQPVILWTNNIIANLIPSLGLNLLEAKPFNLLSFSFAAGMFVLVLVLSIARGRLYCNSVCPVGSFLGLVSKLSVNKIRIESQSCTKCGKCQQVCKANCIDIYTLEVDESRCVACYNCIPVCENSGIGYAGRARKNKVSKMESDSRRRLFIAGSLAYLYAKALPLKAAEKVNNTHIHVEYVERGTVSPPGAQSIEHLKDRCVACHMCVSVCPTKVLQPSSLEYGFTGIMLPKMDFDISFCNYNCTKCGEVCPSGAINQLPIEEKMLTQIGQVHFQKEFCVVESEGTDCGSCSEHCPTQAVRMVPYRNGLMIPETNTSICIGCGACEYACPVYNPHPAIFVVSNITHQKAKKPESEKLEYQETEEFPF